MEKRIIKNQAAHGDIYLVRVDKLPESGITRKRVDKGEPVVLAHSESGHNHYIDAGCASKVEHYTVDGVRDDRALRGYLVVTPDNDVCLRHKKPPPYDHKDAWIPAGIYQIRRHRSYNPWTDTWGRAID